MWAAHTLQHLNPDGVFVVRARLVALAARPVVPARDIVEAHVELVVLAVALGHEAHVARGLDEVVEADCAGGGGGACRPVLICSSDEAASGVVGGGTDKGAIIDKGDVMNKGRVMNAGGINSVYKLQKRPVQRSWQLLAAA